MVNVIRLNKKGIKSLMIYSRYCIGLLMVFYNISCSGEIHPLEKYANYQGSLVVNQTKILRRSVEATCKGKSLDGNEYSLAMRVKPGITKNNSMDIIGYPYFFIKKNNESIFYYMIYKENTYCFSQASEFQPQNLVNFPRINLAAKTNGDIIKIRAKLNRAKKGGIYLDIPVTISIKKNILYYKRDPLLDIESVISSVINSAPPHFLSDDGVGGVEITLYDSSEKIVDKGIPYWPDIENITSKDVPKRPKDELLHLILPDNLPVEKVLPYFTLYNSLDKKCLYKNHYHQEIIFSDCNTTKNTNYYFVISGFNPSEKFRMKKGIKVNIDKIFNYNIILRQIIVNEVTRYRTLPFDKIDKLHRIDDGSCNYYIRYTLDEIMSGDDIHATEVNCDKESSVLHITQGKHSAAVKKAPETSIREHYGERWIEFSSELFSLLNSSNINLYNEQNNKRCEVKIFRKDQKITFQKCPGATNGVKTIFYLEIDGFKRSPLFRMSNYYNIDEFKTLRIKTKDLDIILSSGNQRRSLYIEDIGKNLTIGDSTICTEWIHVTFKAVMRGRQITADNDCQEIKVEWPMGWNKPSIDFQNRDLLQSSTCEEIDEKQRCIFKSREKLLKLKWYESISTKIDTQIGDIQSVTKLDIAVPKDRDNILKKTTISSNNICNNIPEYEIKSAEICGVGDKSCKPVELSTGERYIEIIWKENELPHYFMLNLIQKTNNPKYLETTRKEIDIQFDNKIPSLLDLKIDGTVETVPINIEFIDEDVPYNDEYEFLLYSSKKECENTQSHYENMSFTKDDLIQTKLSVCDSGQYWAKITGKNRSVNRSDCAQGIWKINNAVGITFSLKANVIDYGTKRWLIVVSQSEGLWSKTGLIKSTLTSFIKSNKNKPITLAVVGAKPRTLLRSEDVGDSKDSDRGS